MAITSDELCLWNTIHSYKSQSRPFFGAFTDYITFRTKTLFKCSTSNPRHYVSQPCLDSSLCRDWRFGTEYICDCEPDRTSFSTWRRGALCRPARDWPEDQWLVISADASQTIYAINWIDNTLVVVSLSAQFLRRLDTKRLSSPPSLKVHPLSL